MMCKFALLAYVTAPGYRATIWVRTILTLIVARHLVTLERRPIVAYVLHAPSAATRREYHAAISASAPIPSIPTQSSRIT